MSVEDDGLWKQPLEPIYDPTAHSRKASARPEARGSDAGTCRTAGAGQSSTGGHPVPSSQKPPAERPSASSPAFYAATARAAERRGAAQPRAGARSAAGASTPSTASSDLARREHAVTPSSATGRREVPAPHSGASAQGLSGVEGGYPPLGLDTSGDRDFQPRFQRPIERAAPLLYPDARLSERRWAFEVASALWREATELEAEGEHRLAAHARKRAKERTACGARVDALVCGACGGIAPGSQHEATRAFSCGGRTCPHCERARARREAAQLHRDLVAVMSATPASSNYSLQFLTITVARDPSSESEHTWRALAERRERLFAGLKRLWDRGEAATLDEWRALTLDERIAAVEGHFERLAQRRSERAAARAERDGASWDEVEAKREAARERAHEQFADERDRILAAVFDADQRGSKHLAWREVRPLLAKEGAFSLSAAPGAALYAHVECSTGGHVHLHAIYWGPHIQGDWLARVVARDGCGFAQVRTVASGDLKGAVREVAKYAAKAASPLRAEWVAGEKFAVLHPVIAARWEIACAGASLTRRFGALRTRVELEELDAGEASAQANDEAPRTEHEARAQQLDEMKRAPCPCCGVRGRLRSERVYASDYARACIAARRALDGTPLRDTRKPEDFWDCVFGAA